MSQMFIEPFHQDVPGFRLEKLKKPRDEYLPPVRLFIDDAEKIIEIMCEANSHPGFDLGEKEIGVRKIVYGAKKHLPAIEADLALLEKLLETYERTKTK